MVLYVCSLKVDTPQAIPAGGAYHLVKFPYTSAGESSDGFDMHTTAQPDGTTSAYPDDKSSLIWPTVSGWGCLTAMVQWESGGYTELRDQFVRSPLTAPDTTATDHRAPSPGMQCFTKHHEIWINPATPLALRVSHNDSVTRDMVLAEFKLFIHT